MPARRWRPEPWPLALAAMLAAMVGTGVGFWRIADANPDALVVADAYQASLAYPEIERATARARDRGWSLELRTEPVVAGAHVVVTLRDGQGRVIAPERVALRRERPAEGGLDADLVLAREGDVHAGTVSLPRPGRWHLVARAERGDGALEQRVTVFRP